LQNKFRGTPTLIANPLIPSPLHWHREAKGKGKGHNAYMSPMPRASSALTTRARMMLEWSAMSDDSFCRVVCKSWTWNRLLAHPVHQPSEWV